MSTPPLYGLVLAGGHSTRMGRDKGVLNYHGKPQRQFVWEMLDLLCEKAFVSVREEQRAGIPSLPVIIDVLEAAGPVAGLLAAHCQFPTVAWLVVGCDYPYLRAQDLQLLIEQRHPGKAATAFLNAEKQWPEPLLAIWEPEGLNRFQAAVASGNKSPRKFLEAEQAQLVVPGNAAAIQSVDDDRLHTAVLKQLKDGG